MYAYNSRHWFVLAVAFGLTASAARADVITPDSIPNPPAAVGSADGTPIYAGGGVTTQYKGLGLNFSLTGQSTTAITNLSGVAVWAPAMPLAQPILGVAGGPPFVFPGAEIHYSGPWSGGNFVLPGTLIPTTASTVTLEIMGRGVGVSFFNASGGLLGSATVGGTGPHGGQLYTFTGSGVSSFSVFAPAIDPPPGAASPTMAINPAWGVAEVSFTHAHAPEPSSLVLAGLGALGLAARFGRRRAWGKVA